MLRVVLGKLIAVLFIALVVIVAKRSGALSFAGQMLSRIFVSGRRRDPPVVHREGGTAALPRALVPLVRCRREIEAAVQTLRTIAPAYHRSFEAGVTSIGDDRRRQAIRRDFEDAVIHVARALDRWLHALPRLDAPARARLGAAGPLPDVAALLERFTWLPRRVQDIGHLHFRNDEPGFEARLFALDDELRRWEDALVLERAQVYR